MKYADLDVYKKSYNLALSVYKFSETLPNDEKYGIVSQMKRASLSIPMNIAEGYGKQSTSSELIRFLQMAKGSCNEMTVLLEFSKDLGHLKEEHYQKYYLAYEEVEKMLYGLIKQKRSKPL